MLERMANRFGLMKQLFGQTELPLLIFVLNLITAYAYNNSGEVTIDSMLLSYIFLKLCKMLLFFFF